MSILMIRPYPVARLAEARQALTAASTGQLALLQQLYRVASDELARIDPDEVSDFLQDFPKALRDDHGLLHAAVTLADTWEGLVAIGGRIQGLDRFRGFVWLAAQVRYGLEPTRRDISQLKAYYRGAMLPDTSKEDAALYALAPALIGLGPEFPEELESPNPLPGESVASLLGLVPSEDWAGIDPIDGIAVSAETCRSYYAAVPTEWRSIVGRGLESGLLVRPSDNIGGS